MNRLAAILTAVGVAAALAGCSDDGKVSDTLPPLQTTVTGDVQQQISIDTAPDVVVDDAATPGGIPVEAGPNAWAVAALLEPHGLTLNGGEVACLDGLDPFETLEVTSATVQGCVNETAAAWLDVDALAAVALADATDVQVGCVEEVLGDAPSIDRFEFALTECGVAIAEG